MLWFDVGIKRYTTPNDTLEKANSLWFDVGIKRYTTARGQGLVAVRLWFDVGIKRYTTIAKVCNLEVRCGLM